MAKIYQLKIALRGSSPPIWRRIEVAADTNLEALSWHILHAMGWYGGHLMSFDIGRESFFADKESALGLHGSLMRDARLNKHLETPKQKIRFTYDFGDNWQHDVLLEKILDPEPGTRYPRCTNGKRNCPPEDCGGVWGYAGFLEAISDPKHAEHEDMLDWIGGEFDSEEFDLEEVDRRMRR